MVRKPLCLFVILLSTPVHLVADVVRVEVDSEEDVLGGYSFGTVGPYVKISGRIFFEFDPDNPYNARIIDLALAPRNERGMVEAWSNFVVLRPKFPERGSGTALVEVSNRGGKASLGYFNRARYSRDPVSGEDFGDGLLMRMGLTVIWVGWQHDVPDANKALVAHLPVATDNGQTITGLVRSDWTVDRDATVLGLGHRAQTPYPVADFDDPANVLTYRLGRDSTRHVVPRDKWQFARVDSNGAVIPDSGSIYLPSGFRAGRIYEAVYRGRDPVVVGLGPAIIRDVISYAKYNSESQFAARAGIAIGISQTGRFLRHYLYQGFNTDEHGRMALDGIISQTAGAGRGSFNHRFAQPSRDAHRYSAFFYPTDIFPFTSRAQTDPETGATDGLFEHQFVQENLPKVFYTNTGYEYWGRAAALIHTSVDGTRDVDPYTNERIYQLSGAQHFVGRFPPPERTALDGTDAYRNNPLNFFFNMRALLNAMVAWVNDGVEPPASRYPHVSDGTLVSIDRLEFPSLPGLTPPHAAETAYRADYGPRWGEGIVDNQPPALGDEFPTLVPQVNEDGNELSGIRNVELRVPLATYAPWSLRSGFAGGADEMMDFVGTFIPFSRTPDEAVQRNDPRLTIAERYGSREEYMRLARGAALELAEEGFMLDEDVEHAVENAGRLWDWVRER